MDGIDLVPLAPTNETFAPSASRSTFVDSRPGRGVLRGFVFGRENLVVAHTLARCLRDVPCSVSPLVLTGESGVGKSHLLRALFEEWNELDLGHSIFITAADFSRDVASAIELGDLAPLRERFLLARLVVIEDLPRLDRKVVAQRELCTLLDAFEATGCLLVASTPIPPRELAGLSVPLRDRLSSGLVVKVSRPDQGSRSEILRRLAIQRDILLSTEAAELLCASVEGTAQDLLRSLLEVSVSVAPGQSPRAIAPMLEVSDVRHFLERRAETSGLTLHSLCAATARYFSLTQAILKSSKRSQLVATARGVAMFIAREQTTESLKSIGRFFGGRDHTTVLHNCRKIEKLVASDPDIRLATETIASAAMTIR